MDETTLKVRIVGGRYALSSDEPRSGGMSTIEKAHDLLEDRPCAIKRMKQAADEKLLIESFHREQAALDELSAHPSIVSLYDVGKDENGFYLVLEWVPNNLADYIAEHGAMTWLEFWTTIGRPLLEAIVFAQSQNWTHRDIKPRNILMTTDAKPLIADYGIAKRIETPSLGFTFAQFQSAPFTPPEPDSGGHTLSRDCFSWAAVAVFCLTGTLPADYGELAALAGGLDDTKVPVDLLDAALSHVPALRPLSASALLSDLDASSMAASAVATKSPLCHLAMSPDCMRRLLSSLELGDSKDVETALMEEVSEVQVGIKRIEVAAPGVCIRIFAVTWTLEALLSNGRLVVQRAWPSRATEVERHREAAFRPALTFTFAAPKDPIAADDALSELLIELDAFEEERRDKAAQAKRERIFRIWYAFLRSKADFEAKRENAIPYVDVKLRDPTISLTTEEQAPLELVGQSRVIRLPTGGHVFCDIVDVNLDEVIVNVTSGVPTRLPRHGRLELNVIAAEKSIERQRRALDTVNYDRAPSPRLKAIIVDPNTARPPLTVASLQVAGGSFDDEKIEILRRALGLQDVLAIQGPPGTGKTRLIEEILLQYLERHPKHRVLLSSQTHVALDNVIERITARKTELEIVRIGRLDDAKVSIASRDLLLDRKAQAWSEGVKARAKDYMTDWAADRGISRQNIERGMMAERLILLRLQLQALREGLRKADAMVREAEQRADDKLSNTGSADSAAIEADAIEAEQTAGTARSSLAGLRAEIEMVQVRLRGSGPDGAELADGRNEDLEVWCELLLGSNDEDRRCRKLLEIQEQWALRVGRSSDFHSAMLASAQIVAGTCIGLAGVRGIDQVTFDLCIVDEASKATATEILVPMSRSRKWIIVGDPAQLPPFFEDDSITQLDDFDEQEVRNTLLDRFLEGLPTHSKAVLTRQHRMVEGIGELVSQVFYKGALESPKIKANVTLPGAFPKQVTWLSTTEMSDRRETRRGQSYHNDAECRLIRDVLRKIDFIATRRKKVYDVAVIAGYVAQVKALQDVIRDGSHEWTGITVTCSTVDAFQGSEAEVCVYSVTRSNPANKLGFLRERERLNVALSRGRSALIIVGDDEFCRAAEGQNPFKKVLDHIEANPEHCERRWV